MILVHCLSTPVDITHNVRNKFQPYVSSSILINLSWPTTYPIQSPKIHLLAKIQSLYFHQSTALPQYPDPPPAKPYPLSHTHLFLLINFAGNLPPPSTPNSGTQTYTHKHSPKKGGDAQLISRTYRNPIR